MSDDTTNPEDLDPDLEDQDGDDDPGDGGEWTPPTQEEWKKVQRTLKARKEEATKARREAAAAKEAANGKPPTEAAKEAARIQEASDNRARRSAGLAALMEAGMSRAQAKDAVDLLKLKNLDVDQDGDVDGVDDAVDALKTKFPGLFATDSGKGGGGKPPKARTADGGGRDGGTKSPTDRTTDKLLKAAGLA